MRSYLVKLFLTSSTITENLVKPFELLIERSIAGLTCAFIPDAGDVTDGDKSWITEERDFLKDTYGWNMLDFRLSEKKTSDFEKLSEVDVIWVNGGLSGYLAQVMRKSGFDKILPELLDKGIVYCGSSGGSMVMSKEQDASSWYIGESEPKAAEIPGLGYIDFQIYPHYEDDILLQILNNVKKRHTYILLRDGEAITVTDNYYQIHGEDVKVISGKGP